MKIEHIAIWTNNLERLRQFYIQYFGAESADKYINEKKEFESYFLRFASGARIELMYSPSLRMPEISNLLIVGYSHIAISVGSKETVDRLTSDLQSNGVTLLSGPRYTGDGYYESVILDPDGNYIEITI